MAWRAITLPANLDLGGIFGLYDTSSKVFTIVISILKSSSIYEMKSNYKGHDFMCFCFSTSEVFTFPSFCPYHT